MPNKVIILYEQAIILIPTYNESLNVQAMLHALFAKYSGISILIVDDNSPDHTSNLVDELMSIYPNLYLITRRDRRGLGNAYKEAYQWALNRSFKYFIQMDCDFSHSPDDIKSIFEKLHFENLPVVLGSRFKENLNVFLNWSFKRCVFSKTVNFMLRHFFNMPFSDLTGGFKGFKREALEEINFEAIVSNGFIFQFESIYQLHLKNISMNEIQINFHSRKKGQSKLKLAIIVEALIVVFSLKFERKIQNKTQLAN